MGSGHVPSAILKRRFVCPCQCRPFLVRSRSSCGAAWESRVHRRALAGNTEVSPSARRRPSCPKLGGSKTQQTQSVGRSFTKVIDLAFKYCFSGGFRSTLERRAPFLQSNVSWPQVRGALCANTCPHCLDTLPCSVQTGFTPSKI